jgi:hypothetical protein
MSNMDLYCHATYAFILGFRVRRRPRANATMIMMSARLTKPWLMPATTSIQGVPKSARRFRWNLDSVADVKVHPVKYQRQWTYICTVITTCQP